MLAVDGHFNYISIHPTKLRLPQSISWFLRAQFCQAYVLGTHFIDKCSDLDDAFDFDHKANVIHFHHKVHQELILRTLAFLVKLGGMVLCHGIKAQLQSG